MANMDKCAHVSDASGSKHAIDPSVQAEAARVGAELVSDHFDYVWGVAKALQGELGEGFSELPMEHPSYDPGLDQVFAPDPPSMVVGSP